MFFEFISIAKLKDFKTFQRSVNIFDKNSIFKQKRVELFLRNRELTKSSFFERHKGVIMKEM